MVQIDTWIAVIGTEGIVVDGHICRRSDLRSSEAVACIELSQRDPIQCLEAAESCTACKPAMHAACSE